jgi:hypothetical protein
MRHLSYLSLQGILVVAVHSPVAAGDAVVPLLPTSGAIQAKVMQIGMPLEAQRIAEKMQDALASQPDWTKAFLTNAEPGRPLPYHPNLQVTEEEYKSLLAAAQRPTLVQIGSVSLFAERQVNGDVRLVTQPTTSKVNGLTISFDERSVTTRLTTLTEVKPIDNQDRDSATGRWTGTQWRYESISPNQILAVKLALGKRTDQGDCVLYYDVKNVGDGRNDVYYEVLLFPPPQ